MHIRLLLLTFFLQFYPKLVKNGHIYNETPLLELEIKMRQFMHMMKMKKIMQLINYHQIMRSLVLKVWEKFLQENLKIS